MKTILLLNILSSLILIIAYVPQITELRKTKNADGVSNLFWVFISLSTSYSLFNLFVTDAHYYVMITQFFNAAIAFYVLQKVLKLKSSDWLPWVLFYIVINLLLYLSFPVEITQNIATIAIVLAYVDQIYHFAKSKNATGTNPIMYLLFSTALILLTISMSISGVHIFIIITEFTNSVLLLVCLILSIVYRRKA